MKLLSELNRTNARLDKLVRLKGISFLNWKTFVYAYNPYLVYHQKWTDDMIDLEDLGEPTEQMFDILDSLSNGDISGNSAKERVQGFSNQCGDLIKLIINKDLQCGVTATTFNKVHEFSIPQFKVQLAKEVPLDNLEYPILGQLKYDGVRLIAINNEGSVIFRTRNGKEVKLPALKEMLEQFNAVNFILDGEITLVDGKTTDRTSVSGMINSAMHGGTILEDLLVYNVFDTMSLEEFENCKSTKTYDIRFKHLESIVIALGMPNVQLAQTMEFNSEQEINNVYDGIIAMGYEGLILKPHKHYYTFKRSKDWIKLKEIKSIELTCVGIEEGTGKYQGMIGALVCRGVVEHKIVTVKVGSGLSDLQRGLQSIHYLKEQIEVKYNSVIQDSVTKEYSLFLPRFVEVRFDK